MAFPSTKETFLPETDAVLVDDVWQDGSVLLATKQNALYTLVEAMQDEYGLAGDLASPTGSHSAKLAFLTTNAAQIVQHNDPPVGATAGLFWLDLNFVPVPRLQRFDGAVYGPVGAMAIGIGDKPIDWVDTPATGDTLVYDSGAGSWSFAPGGTGGGGASLPFTAKGDLVYSVDNSGTPGRLPVGAEGTILSSIGGLPAWVAGSAYIPAPAGATQGALLYLNSAGAWTHLPPAGSDGMVLHHHGPSAIPYWANVSVSPPGSAVAAPSGQARGDLLRFGFGGTTNWERLPLGPANNFLKSNGTDAEWAALPGGGGTMNNPMTTAGDTIYGSTGGTPGRIGIGTAGQLYRVAAAGGLPEWFTAPYLTSPMTTQEDIIKQGASGPVRLAKGTNGQLLGISGAGVLSYVAPPTGTLPGGSAVNDLMYWNGTSWGLLGVGAVGEVLTVGVISTVPVLDWQAPSGGSGGHVIVNPAGSSMTARSKLKFAGIAVVDDSAGTDETIVTVGGVGGTVTWPPFIPPPLATNWTIVNGAGTVAKTDEATGGVFFLGNGDTGDVLRAIDRTTIPGTSSWSITMGFAPFTAYDNYYDVGWYIRDNGGTPKYIFLSLSTYNSAGTTPPGFIVTKWNSTTSNAGRYSVLGGTGQFYVVPPGAAPYIWLRLTVAPPFRTYSFSLDGVHFRNYVSSSDTDFLTPTHFGVGMASGAGGVNHGPPGVYLVDLRVA